MAPPSRRAFFLLPLALAALAGAPACGSVATGGSGGAGGAGSSHASSAHASSAVHAVSSSAASSSAGGGGASHGTISDSQDSALEAETGVAVAPDGTIAAVWIADLNNGSLSIGSAFSTDGGATFSPPAFIDAPAGRYAGDPTVASDAQGNLYASFIGFRLDNQGQPNDMQVYVTTAPAGTLSFGAPVVVSDPAEPLSTVLDKPWIVVTSAGTLLVTYASLPLNSDFAIVAARSTDGVNWTRSPIAEDATGGIFRNLTMPCVPTTGSRVWATWFEVGATASIMLGFSDDQGATWSKTTVAASLDTEPVAADDPGCVAEGNEVWVIYGVADPSVPAGMGSQSSVTLRVAHSTDGGLTIADRMNVHDTKAGKVFLHPQIARETGGALDIVYYAAQMDMDDAGSYRQARMADAATGFGPSAVVETPLTYLERRDAVNWLGDYTGVTWRGGSLYTTYATNPSGASHVGFARVKTP